MKPETLNLDGLVKKSKTYLSDEANKKVSIEVGKEFVKALEEAILSTLEYGGKVQLQNFMSFEVKETKARVGRNPKTNETIQIPAGKAPKATFRDKAKDRFKK